MQGVKGKYLKGGGKVTRECKKERERARYQRVIKTDGPRRREDGGMKRV